MNETTYAAPPRFRLELVREPGAEPEHLRHPEAVARFLAVATEKEPAETMGAVFLDARNRLIGWLVMHRGTINRAAVEPRQALQGGLLCNAVGFILYHNHPSGDPSPSVEDLAFTRRCAEAGEVVGVRLLDHLILGGEGGWVSLKKRGGW